MREYSILKAKMKDEKILLEDKKKTKKVKEEHKRALSEESKSLDNKMVRNEIPSTIALLEVRRAQLLSQRRS